ncbi:helix-turn-helix transcriptional regulator [Raoultibacter phocaeensis]|uniref:helix-turn-helix transcriptional regulator n=1 Tax=Raoultibacter phocaeensis TaxID=2479841 RepID=UPI00111B1D78|nr:helix-turn-helix domain-containing protein [Raoultibacter phocaeensis]
MKDFKAYLEEELGLALTATPWNDAANLPVFLSRAAQYWQCVTGGVRFLVAEVNGGESLPDLKRIPSQLARRTDLSVVVVADIDARQRKALVRQGVPFIVPGRQAYLPFLGFVATSARPVRALGERLSPSAQAALVALIANPEIRFAGELRELTEMPSSSVSRALDELSRRKLIVKTKEGRDIVISRSAERNVLLKNAMPYLASPVMRILYARKSGLTSELSLAGESALSERTMIGAPSIEQRAVFRKDLGGSEFEEVQEGELPDMEVSQIQIWSYDPLVAGRKEIDDVSLALSLVGENDERINGQLDALFNEEDLWQ